MTATIRNKLLIRIICLALTFVFVESATGVLTGTGEVAIAEVCDDSTDHKSEEQGKKHQDKGSDYNDLLCHSAQQMSQFFLAIDDGLHPGAISLLLEQHTDVFTPPPEA